MDDVSFDMAKMGHISLDGAIYNFDNIVMYLGIEKVFRSGYMTNTEIEIEGHQILINGQILHVPGDATSKNKWASKWKIQKAE